MSKTLFVTVGSTKFEPLIEQVLSTQTLERLRKFGFRKAILQIGSGHHQHYLEHCVVESSTNATNNDTVIRFVKDGIEINAYRYKKSLRDDLNSADLVISHAGSASVIESLEAGKTLIVVVNEALMDNHQLELAEQMANMGFLVYTACKGLVDKLDLIFNKEWAGLTQYMPGNPNIFGNFLNSIL